MIAISRVEAEVTAQNASAERCRNGEGRNRTGDTTVFSRVLYRLSYLARAAQCSPVDLSQ